jgi:hypothetical protein
METARRIPLARDKGLVVEELGDELLVYDLDVKTAHCLTPSAARVWRSCDGKSGPDALADRLGMDSAEITRALDELERCDLLVTAGPKKAGLSRRDFGMKVTKVAAAAATLPLILSVAAPAVAATQSQELFCIALTPAGGTNNCNICNQQTGNNTLCCCCHQPTRAAGGNTITSGNKSCAADARQCCCGPPKEVNGWSTAANPAHHCTESNGNQQLCGSFVAAGGCN